MIEHASNIAGVKKIVNLIKLKDLKMSKEKIKVAVQMDKLNKINKDTDSTLALIQEAIKKSSLFSYNVIIYILKTMS